MDLINQALHTLAGWLEVLIGLLLGVLTVIEGFFRALMVQVGVPERLQQVVLLVVAVLVIVAILRVFGGVLRVLLVALLILLVLHVVLPSLGHAGR